MTLIIGKCVTIVFGFTSPCTIFKGGIVHPSEVVAGRVYSGDEYKLVFPLLMLAR